MQVDVEKLAHPSDIPDLDQRIVRAHGTYARRGEWVTCENGDKICQFSRDVKCGEMYDDGIFVNWQQPSPKRGEMEHPCKCGARFFAGMQFHLSDGWRV